MNSPGTGNLELKNRIDELEAEIVELKSRGLGIVDSFFVDANAVTERTIIRDGIYLLVINNTYNVGGIWCISTGGSQQTGARIVPVVPSGIAAEGDYFTISSEAYNSIKISTREASGDAFVYRLDL